MHDPVGAEPFTISVPDDVLDDLRERLAKTRWPIEAKAPPWTYGASLAYMKDICAYWRDTYDWRKAEARLNKYPNYKVTLGGKKVHFMVEKGSGPNPTPLIITHGWPGSVVEFLDIIEPLAHPERFGGDEKDAFTIVLPSLPGYGFSDAPDLPMHPRDVGHMWHELMTEVLGCERYFVQGGDWGGIISSWLALDHPEKISALHLNISAFIPEVPGDELSAEERDWMERYAARRAREVAYHQIHGTKPQTLSYGLQDSPAGCAAWMLEKFHAWSEPSKDGKDLPFDKDLLLTNVMLFWLYGSNAPTWFYCSIILGGTGRTTPPGQTVQVPTGFLFLPKDIALAPPDSWLRRSYGNIVHRKDASEGGHFAAFEKGDLFVNDLREFFREYR